MHEKRVSSAIRSAPPRFDASPPPPAYLRRRSTRFCEKSSPNLQVPIQFQGDAGLEVTFTGPGAEPHHDVSGNR